MLTRDIRYNFTYLLHTVLKIHILSQQLRLLNIKTSKIENRVTYFLPVRVDGLIEEIDFWDKNRTFSTVCGTAPCWRGSSMRRKKSVDCYGKELKIPAL